MATQQETQLVQQYCYLGTDLPQNPQPGEMAPRQDTVAKMEGNSIDLVLDGRLFFSRIADEISLLKTSEKNANPYLYCCFWGLDMFHYPAELIQLSSSKDIADGYNWFKRTYISHRFPNFTIPSEFEIASEGTARYFKYLPNWDQNPTTHVVKDVYSCLKEAAGIPNLDIRMMGWINPINLKFEKAGEFAHRGYNLQTTYNVNKLRELLGKDNVFLNVLGHPVGGCHCKFFVAGSDNYMRAYVGGIDPLRGRERPSAVANGWHDLAVAIEGPAAAGVLRHFVDQWNELALRTEPIKIHYYPQSSGSMLNKTVVSHTKSADCELEYKEAKTAVKNTERNCFVQVLRTVPQMNMMDDLDVPRINQYLNDIPAQYAQYRGVAQRYLTSNKDLVVDNVNIVLRRVFKFDRVPLWFANDGIFEFKVAMCKAISAATNYIFWVDQSLWSEEIFGWILDRMVTVPNLKVIFLTGDASMSSFTAHSLRESLRTRVVNTANIAFWCWKDRIVHPKTVLIDDCWAFVGSQNHAARSMYTDFELGVSFASQTKVTEIRKKLWKFYANADYVGQAPIPEPRDLNEALCMWNRAWGFAAAALPGSFIRQPVPPLDALADQHDRVMGMYQDSDSRDNW